MAALTEEGVDDSGSYGIPVQRRALVIGDEQDNTRGMGGA
jgi:hypothetical protein